MLTEVTVVPFKVAEKTAVPVLLDPRVTVSAVVVGLPKLSCSWTVIGPRLAVDDAAPETAEVVITNLLADPAELVSEKFTVLLAPENAEMLYVPEPVLAVKI